MRKQAAITGVAVLLAAANAGAVTSAELYTGAGYQYGRFAARIQFAPGSGVVSSFFLWKDGSEQDGVFWNELDFEKLESGCHVETNTIYDEPIQLAPERHVLDGDLCGGYHVYAYEWTPEYIAWSMDGVEIRRVTGPTAEAYAANTAEGMQLRFNVWPGDATFGGDFDPAILPVYQYIDWVEYSSYANGTFQVEWREDFTANTLPSGWQTGSWDSPKGLSTHATANVGFVDGYAVLALTADDAKGYAGVTPRATDDQAEPLPTPAPTEPGVTPPLDPGSVPITPAPTDSQPPAPAPSTSAPTAPASDADGSSCHVAGVGSGGGSTPLGAAGLLGWAIAVLVRRRSRRS